MPRVAASGNPARPNPRLVWAGRQHQGLGRAHHLARDKKRCTTANLGQACGILCCDVSLDGLTVAGGLQLQGEDADIVYWTPDKPPPRCTHNSTHRTTSPSCFRPSGRNVLLFAWLISTSETVDEAVRHVGV
ncbi:hypothetical protein C8J57DRAFT_1217843 [Mycena rebaudengoi]|nr:hypothetical protein C8J57DRAFT_1217843 [Mycena rebaudengoi]